MRNRAPDRHDRKRGSESQFDSLLAKSLETGSRLFRDLKTGHQHLVECAPVAFRSDLSALRRLGRGSGHLRLCGAPEGFLAHFIILELRGSCGDPTSGSQRRNLNHEGHEAPPKAFSWNPWDSSCPCVCVFGEVHDPFEQTLNDSPWKLSQPFTVVLVGAPKYGNVTRSCRL